MPFMPFARAVALDDFGLPPAGDPGNAWPPDMSRLRALVELLVLLAGGAVGTVVFVLPFILIRLPDHRWYNVLGSIGPGVGTLVACAIMLLVARQKPASIGLTRRNLIVNAAIGVGAMAALYAGLLVPLGLVLSQFGDLADQPRKAIEETFPPMSLAWLVLMMTFVSLWEEVVFRGFLLTRLRAIFGRWWLAVLVGASVFGPIHGYQGFVAVIMITVLAVLLSTLFIWRKSLVPGMVLHWLHNVGTMLIVQTLYSSSP
ncbi:MAG TPA: type II CAAX endopeptidase family protein [Phycisphaerae bacterium]|nr:type II CAAX endopeptidase family protein [Phycisphaerae bacterium]